MIKLFRVVLGNLKQAERVRSPIVIPRDAIEVGKDPQGPTWSETTLMGKRQI